MTADHEQVRLFTVDEANETLAEVAPLLERLRAAQSVMEDRIEGVTNSVPTNGGGQVHREFLDASREAAAVGTRLQELGIVVRDPSTGLIDFPAERDGEPVYLCWRLGEDRVAWWHPRDAGFAGRRPL